MLNVGSLFSGIGGIELGLERAGGFKTSWFVERDPYAQAVLKKHWPGTPIHDDVEKIDFKRVQRVDIITGGFPCQDISNAGKRVGIEGSRSGLWKHCVRAISDLRPRFGVFENVAALTQRGLDRVLLDLAEIGYDAEWYCFPAKSVGAPHQRDRIVILAYPCSWNTWEGESPKQRSGKRHSSGREAEYTIFNSRRSNGFAFEIGGGEGGENFPKWWGVRNVADSDDAGQPDRPQQYWGEQASSGSGECGVGGCGSRSDDVADSEHDGQHEGAIGFSIGKSQDEGRMRESEGCSAGSPGWWFVEPGLGRVAHGVPHRVDRIKCLGNAVVPAWAEAIAKTIKEADQ